MNLFFPVLKCSLFSCWHGVIFLFSLHYCCNAQSDPDRSWTSIQRSLRQLFVFIPRRRKLARRVRHPTSPDILGILTVKEFTHYFRLPFRLLKSWSLLQDKTFLDPLSHKAQLEAGLSIYVHSAAQWVASIIPVCYWSAGSKVGSIARRLESEQGFSSV